MFLPGELARIQGTRLPGVAPDTGSLVPEACAFSRWRSFTSPWRSGFPRSRERLRGYGALPGGMVPGWARGRFRSVLWCAWRTARNELITLMLHLSSHPRERGDPEDSAVGDSSGGGFTRTRPGCPLPLAELHLPVAIWVPAFAGTTTGGMARFQAGSFRGGT
jgi:hypothetical protein